MSVTKILTRQSAGISAVVGRQCLGFRLLQLFVITRVKAESHAPLAKSDGTTLPYHSQKPSDYFSISGKLTFACTCAPVPACTCAPVPAHVQAGTSERAYFYAQGRGGECPLDEALSLPERCYSDLLMESAELLGVEEVYSQGLQVVARLLGLTLPELALETAVAEHSQTVKAYYAQKASFPVAEEGPILVARADGKGVPMVRRETAHSDHRAATAGQTVPDAPGAVGQSNATVWVSLRAGERA